MRYSVDYRGTNYSGSVDMDQLDGTCGIVLATYLMPNDLTILDRCENTRRAVAVSYTHLTLPTSDLV